MSEYKALRLRWLTMSEEERCLAYGKAVLADARRRDRKFPRELNEAKAMHEMETTFIYGGGER